jgi:hypothetical protein
MSKVVLGPKLAISVANLSVPKYRLSRSRNTGTFLILQSAEREGKVEVQGEEKLFVTSQGGEGSEERN